MSALDNYSPTAVSIVKLFAYPLRSAPTADLVTWGVNQVQGGQTPGQLLTFIFNLAIPQSPFTAYGVGTTDTAFCTALVDNLCFGTNIGSATRAEWVAYLVPLVGTQATRGDFALWVGSLVDGYQGDVADLLTLKAALAQRAETAAQFAQSPAGAVWDGQGYAQLLAPLSPAPEPTYALTASASSVNEGSSITFTLDTTQVAAGTAFGYTLSGTGLGSADIAGGQLAGSFTVDTSGRASVTITLVADAVTEGPETLRLALNGNLAQADVTVNDTSTTPPPPPTFALAASTASVDEGSSVVITLTTTNLAAGVSVTYSLSGTGLTAADVVGGVLTGVFTVDAQGIGTTTIGLVADATTEGNESLRMVVTGNAATIELPINDTSITPPPVGAPDTVVIADNMNNNNAHAPGSPAEGEIPIDTYLTYDLLNQDGPIDSRMTVAGLKATKPVAGAPLDATNFSADRGNIPQVSNQTLYTYDLGLQTDRVDYSAETGRIAAVVSAVAPADTLWVLVNDNGTDNNFGNATDRIDTLRNVEEVVASAGGGVLDLTNSSRDWLVTFSRNFNSTTDVDTARDRATHRMELADLNTGIPDGRAYLEYRDAGGNAGVQQATAAWTSVQGSDRNETVVFSSAQSTEARTNVLRGGTNTVKFNELTRSILVDVTIAPWAPSTNPADDTNSTGLTTATTTFTNGDGVTPLSGNTTVTSSHTPDNGVAPGTLKIVGSQDAEDAISLTSTALPKVITLGQSLGGADGFSVRLSASQSSNALEVTGFELLRDNGASDDLYVIDNIFRATQGSPRLTDGAGADHDAIRLGNEALGSAAVGGAVGAVNLATLNGAAPGFGVDFDVLDLSGVSATGLQALGTVGADDELVVGPLGAIGLVTGFEALVLTNASVDKGAALTLDLDVGAVKAGTTTLFSYAGAVISAGGLVFNTAGQASTIGAASTAFNITVVDTTAGAGGTVWGGSAADYLIGGSGDDTLRGGGGNDTLDGGVPGGTGSFTETWAFTIAGTPDAVAAAANRITIAMTIDGTALTLTEAAVADAAYGDGNGAVVDGASTNTIGTAMAGLINANLASINAGPGTGTLTGATWDNLTGTVLLSFLPGYNANDVVTFVLNSGAGPDGGTFALSAGVNVNGGNGGSDTFVLEKSAAANGHDTLLNFTPASDKIDVSSFAGAAIAAASPHINGATGGTLAGVATTAEFVYNMPGGTISSANFATSPAPGKFVLADGGRCVVAVTADPTGARGDGSNTLVSLYYAENGAAAGLDDLSVMLVATISGPVELTLSDVFWALS